MKGLQWLRRCLTYCVVLYDRAKGPRTVEESETTTEHDTSLIVKTVSGHLLTIRCHQRVFKEYYGVEKRPGRTRMVYEVSGVSTKDVPGPLNQVLSQRIIYPAFLPLWVGGVVEKQYAINAYLDFIRNELRGLKHL